ncbi:MAG: hypothetical protein ABFD75_03905 [Smithella sp.]
MNKKRAKTTSSQGISNKTREDKFTEEVINMQTKIFKLQDSLNFLFSYLTKKNIINADEFKTYLINEFKANSEKKTISNANLQGTVSMTYYNKESLEVIQ